MAELLIRTDARQRRSTGQRTWLVVGLHCLAMGVPLAVYLRTLAPSVYSLDSPELVTAAYTLGVAHAPGYPLYTLLGWVWSHALPLGDVAFRLNLLSAVLGAGTILLVYAVAQRLVRDKLASFTAALLLAFSYWFWANSLVAEVYTLDVFLLAAMLLFVLEWRQRRQKAALLAFALFFGLSLANRTTSALCGPAFAAYVLMSARRKEWRVYLAMPAFWAAGLMFYLYIPAVYRANPIYAWSGPRDVASISGLWWLVSAQPFQRLVFAFGPAQALQNLGECMWWLTASFMGLGLVLGLVGIWRQFVTSPRELLLLGGIFLPQLVFYANYNAADRELMLLPVYLVWALWVALGAAFVANLARSYAPHVRAAVVGSSALFLALPLVALAVNYPLVDLSSDNRPRNEAMELLTAAEPNAVVIGRWIDVSPILYLQKVEHQRPDLQLIFAPIQNEQYLWNVVRANTGTRAIYIPQEAEILRGQYDFLRVGEWYRVTPKGSESMGR